MVRPVPEGVSSSPSVSKGSGVSAFFAIIRGRVQGVGFRYTCLNEARRIGLLGWVRNTPDGDVEVWSEGPTEKQELFLSWLRQGPPNARVDSFSCEMRRPTGKYRNFSVKDGFLY
ncbi:MAG: acylphosphatase [Treponema sp.]|jgi:acylphosphatase|nr:acylphosphatase [Treponema sp.]